MILLNLICCVREHPPPPPVFNFVASSLYQFLRLLQVLHPLSFNKFHKVSVKNISVFENEKERYCNSFLAAYLCKQKRALFSALLL